MSSKIRFEVVLCNYSHREAYFGQILWKKYYTNKSSSVMESIIQKSNNGLPFLNALKQ